MCGIVGYFSKNPQNEDQYILFKLIRQSKIRGMHAYGLSYLSGDNLVTRKYYQHELRQIKVPNTNMLIFHNRYSTSGDYANHDNNQPIHIDDMSMVFNGVIEMCSKPEMERRWRITMQTENDGEIIMRAGKFEPQQMLKLISFAGSYSGLMIRNKTLYAMTNGKRPLWKLEVNGSTFFASTKDIFIRAIGECDPQPVSINELHQWTLS